jgi:lactate permease
MENTNLPIEIGHWLLALLPIIVLLIFLVFLRWKAPEAGPIGMFVAAIIAVVAFRTPWDTLAVAGAKGVWDAIFILYVVWPALLLYRVTEQAGAFDALRRGIQKFSRNQLYLVLAFGWVFASFLQGIAGFGTPIAVVAPLLLAIGVRPIYAVAIPLIGHSWANMFGTLAVGWLATLQVIDLQNETATAFQTGILLWIPNLTAGFMIAWMFGRMAAIRQAWPVILIISLVHGGGQLALTLWNPVLSNFPGSNGRPGDRLPAFQVGSILRTGGRN